MSEFSCPVVRLEKIEKHPNADSLSLTEVEGCTVVIRTDDWKKGDLAVYVPVDAVIPESVPGTEFLKDKRRIRAARLRGIFSMGLLLPLTSMVKTEIGLSRAADIEVGTDVAAKLGIVKYEEPIKGGNSSPALAGKAKKTNDPGLGPVYDLESYRKYGKRVFKDGDYVVATEKIHGTNFRFGHKTVKKGFRAFLRKLFRRPPKTVFYVGSHKTWRDDDNSVYWKIAKEHDLAERTAAHPDICFYGEIYGDGVQDLTYGAKDGELKYALFDMWDSVNKEWIDYEDFVHVCAYARFPTVPEVYRGTFKPEEIEPLCNGKSALAPKQIREGIVIRKLPNFVTGEKANPYTGRDTLKLVGEDYLLRKGGTEHH